MSIAHLLLQNLWWLPITLTAQNYQHSFVFIAFTLYHFTLKILVFNWRLLCLFSRLNFITALSTKAIAPIWQMTKRRLRAMSDFPLFTYLVPDSSLQFVPSRLFWLLHSWESGHRTFLNGSPLILIFRCQALASSEYAEHIHKTKQHLWTHCSLSPFYLWNEWP